MATWSEEQKAQVIQEYQDAEPTPATSTEIVKDIAERMEQSPNGVRMVLVQAGVYLKKEAGKAEGKTAVSKDGTSKAPRVSKESSIAALAAAIEAKGLTVDTEILEKLTGKAAVYFTGLMA